MDKNVKQAAAVKSAEKKAAALVVNLRNLQNQNPEEFQDSIADTLRLAIIIEEPLEDGFQPLADLFEMIRGQRYLVEIIEDAPVFWKELKDIVVKDPVAGINAIVAAYVSVKESEEFGKISSGIANALFLLANNYHTTHKAFNEILIQKNLWEYFLDGRNLLDEHLAGTLGLA